jgi:type II secretory pathway component PulF
MDQPLRRSSLVVTGLLVGLAVVLWAALVWELLAVVPRYERLFADFRLRLPQATVVTLNVSRWVGSYWYVLVLTLLPALTAAAVVSYLLRHGPAAPRWLRVLWFVLLLGVPAAAHVFLWVSILQPYWALLEGLGGRKA